MNTVPTEEVVKTVYEGLKKQGGASVLIEPYADVLYSCRYRGSEGRKCAVGLLIPDDEYSQALERKPLDKVYRECESLKKYAFDDLEVLQEAHDSSFQIGEDCDSFLSRFRENIKEILGIELEP